MKIGICAPSTPFTRDDADRVSALAAAHYPAADLLFHDQCFFEDGHFAGSDDERLDAFCALANDASINAIWFVRGGYGACRIAEAAIKQIGDAAHDKTYMGYSDAGNMLGALYGAGVGFVAHGPMPADIRRDDGEAAVLRALSWLLEKDKRAAEPFLDERPQVAFNLMTLAMIVGTPIMPDLSGHVLIIEEVSEYLYAFDRALFHVASHLSAKGLAGIRLGRVSDVPENDRPFGESAEEITKRWCARSNIDYLGRADIGHDTANRIVPFGKRPTD